MLIHQDSLLQKYHVRDQLCLQRETQDLEKDLVYLLVHNHGQ